ncbi:Uncharacterised protein [Mycobacteroides abscessus subsp. abscessus]|nr:Uncharacterised protein [Mycobacteroides abscessus subsp. abscessus]
MDRGFGGSRRGRTRRLRGALDPELGEDRLGGEELLPGTGIGPELLQAPAEGGVGERLLVEGVLGAPRPQREVEELIALVPGGEEGLAPAQGEFRPPRGTAFDPLAQLLDEECRVLSAPDLDEGLDEIGFVAADVGIDLVRGEFVASPQMAHGLSGVSHPQQAASLQGVELGEQAAVLRRRRQGGELLLDGFGVACGTVHEQRPRPEDEDPVGPHAGQGDAVCDDGADEFVGQPQTARTHGCLGLQAARLQSPDRSVPAAATEEGERGLGRVEVLGEHEPRGDREDEFGVEVVAVVVAQGREAPHRRPVRPAGALEPDRRRLEQPAPVLAEVVDGPARLPQQLFGLRVLAAFAAAHAQGELEEGDLGGRLGAFPLRPAVDEVGGQRLALGEVDPDAQRPCPHRERGRIRLSGDAHIAAREDELAALVELPCDVDEGGCQGLVVGAHPHRPLDELDSGRAGSLGDERPAVVDERRRRLLGRPGEGRMPVLEAGVDACGVLGELLVAGDALARPHRLVGPGADEVVGDAQMRAAPLDDVAGLEVVDDLPQARDPSGEGSPQRCRCQGQLSEQGDRLRAGAAEDVAEDRCPGVAEAHGDGQRTVAEPLPSIHLRDDALERERTPARGGSGEVRRFGGEPALAEVLRGGDELVAGELPEFDGGDEREGSVVG